MWLVMALGVLEGAVFAASSVHLPGWVSVGAVVALAGVYLRWRENRFQAMLHEATAARTVVDMRVAEEDLQKRILQRSRAEYLEMESQVSRLREDSSAKDAKIAEQATRITELERAVERVVNDRDRRLAAFRRNIQMLHDEIGKLRSGRDSERFGDGDPPPSLES